MNASLFFLFSLFSKRVQILKTEYKFGQYCTPLTQSDYRYFFVLAVSLNVVEWLFVILEAVFKCSSIWANVTFLFVSSNVTANACLANYAFCLATI